MVGKNCDHVDQYETFVEVHKIANKKCWSNRLIKYGGKALNTRFSDAFKVVW